VFPLQLLGFDVDFINSVHFSNHTGYPKGWEGDILTGEQLDKILAGLERNGLLSDIQHILTGYIGSETFLESILKVVKSVRKYGRVRYVCDPVLGDRESISSTDSGKFYVPENLVEVYKRKVLPIADVLTPNQFEVEQLTGIRVTSLSSVKQACTALHDMGLGLVFVTSCVFASDTNNISIVASQRHKNKHTEQWILEVPIVPGSYTGTGDLCSALLLAHTARFPDNLPKAMELVSNTMQAVVERTHKASSRSVKSRELRLIQSQSDIENPTIRYKCRKIS
jgi:pyridoxine kinase